VPRRGVRIPSRAGGFWEPVPPMALPKILPTHLPGKAASGAGGRDGRVPGAVC
jgi:hypothetical protein